MNKKNIVIISSIIVILILISVLVGYKTFKKDEIISFYIPQNYSENTNILVENEPVLKNDNILTPITLTTTRPVSITVGDETKEIKINNLSKKHFIKLDIYYNDRVVNYLLRTLPDTFPEITTNNKKGLKGYVLTCFDGFRLVTPSYVAVFDMNGKIVYYRGNNPPNYSMYHFKKVTLPNGKIRYIAHIQTPKTMDDQWILGYQLIMDEKFRPIDKVKVLKTDKHEELMAEEHDIIMLDDGHYILIGYDMKDEKLPNGEVAQVAHDVIQEQKDGKVILDWNELDYPIIKQMAYENLPQFHPIRSDYLHVNSLALDPKDDNLIVSSASGYYVMKINRKTGEIMWILGGKLNQFEGIPEGLDFVRQHDVHYLTDGRLVMYDNHIANLDERERDYHKVDFENKNARILIYDLDENNKKVKSAKAIPLKYRNNYLGSIQELEDGKWFVGCGNYERYSAKMIDENNDVLWTSSVKEPHVSYRSYYFKTLD